MVFYILSLHKIEALEYKLDDFLADDLVQAIQSGNTKIANTDEIFNELKRSYPTYYKYVVSMERK
jgi:hypothetical protein